MSPYSWVAIWFLLTIAATVFFCVFIGPLFKAIDKDKTHLN